MLDATVRRRFRGVLPAGGGWRIDQARATESPWDRGSQHGGPPTALLAQACIRLGPKPEFRLARITVEFLAPVPRSRLRVAAQITRTGRRARLIEAVLSVGGSAVALARA